MGFSNEKLTEQEIELIKKTEHEFMVNVHHNHFCYVGHGTVDRGKKIWLIECPGGYDYEYRELGQKFVLIYGGIAKDNIVELYLENIKKDNDPEKNKVYNSMFIMYWKIKNMKIPDALKISRGELIPVLEDALSMYGIMGDLDEKEYDYYGKVKAIIKE